jgi:hypothetical protein
MGIMAEQRVYQRRDILLRWIQRYGDSKADLERVVLCGVRDLQVSDDRKSIIDVETTMVVTNSSRACC